MNKKTPFLLFALIATFAIVTKVEALNLQKALNQDIMTASSEPKSGKWVAEYGGQATPFRCTCTSSMSSSECLVGDYTSNTSLCE